MPIICRSRRSIPVRINDLAPRHCHAERTQGVQDANRAGMRRQHVGKTPVRLRGFVEVSAAEGGDVRVSWWWGRVFVNRSQVIGADISGANGTIHAINAVLLPPS